MSTEGIFESYHLSRELNAIRNCSKKEGEEATKTYGEKMRDEKKAQQRNKEWITDRYDREGKTGR